MLLRSKFKESQPFALWWLLNVSSTAAFCRPFMHCNYNKYLLACYLRPQTATVYVSVPYTTKVFFLELCIHCAAGMARRYFIINKLQIAAKIKVRKEGKSHEQLVYYLCDEQLIMMRKLWTYGQTQEINKKEEDTDTDNNANTERSQTHSAQFKHTTIPH